MNNQSGIYKTDTGAVVKAAVFGAVAGAAAVALSDKKKRKALMDTLNNLKEKGKQSVDQAQTVIENKTEEAKKELSKNLGKAKKKLDRPDTQ